MERLSMAATFTPVEDLTAVDRHFLLMYSTCSTCNTAGIWHKQALSQNQQQHKDLFVFKLTYRKTSDRSPRLLSVQVSQTPGLYAGPGVYTGPGLYHNTSKNRQLSYLPGISILLFSH